MNSEYRLIVERGPDQGREFRIPVDGADIGRSDQNAFVLTDGELSRKHCRLDFRNGTLWVSDLASANGTIVNGTEIQERPLSAGDTLQLGESFVRVLSDAAPASQASVPVPAPPAVPPAPVPASSPPPTVDLGLRKESAAAHSPSSNPRQALRWTIMGVLLLIVAALCIKFILEPPSAGQPPSPSSAARPPPKPLSIHYTKLEADLDNIFRYELLLQADGSLSVQIDDLRQSRHVRRESEKPIAQDLLAELTRTVTQSGVLSLDENYEGIASPGQATEYDLAIAIGNDVGRVRVSNRAEPEEFRDAREKIETFVRNELGLWAVEYSTEQLCEMAQDNLLVGQRLLMERDIQPGNLHEAGAKFRECLNLLETVDPKPEFHDDALQGRREAERLLDERYTDLNFAADRAIKMRDWAQAADSLRELMRLIPDRSDDRNRDAERRLLDVEYRLRKQGARK